MSSGQAKWEEEAEDAAFSNHCRRLEQMGIPRIASLIEKISESVHHIEKTQSFSRNGWAHIDSIKRDLEGMK